jgi:hypothetical protein
MFYFLNTNVLSEGDKGADRRLFVLTIVLEDCVASKDWMMANSEFEQMWTQELYLRS